MKRYILFDHDGVLVETENWYYAANVRALAEVGVEIPKEEYLERMAEGKSSWDRARDEGVPEEDIAEVRRHRDAYYQGFLRTENIEVPGVIETLEKLAPRYRMAIVTTSKPADFELIHRDRKIVGYMEFVLMRGDYERAKPHPEPYLTALRRFGANRREAVVVEDSARGLKSAVAAGIDCLIVRNEFTSSHDFSGALGFVDHFTELPEAIERWFNS